MRLVLQVSEVGGHGWQRTLPDLERSRRVSLLRCWKVLGLILARMASMCWCRVCLSNTWPASDDLSDGWGVAWKHFGYQLLWVVSLCPVLESSGWHCLLWYSVVHIDVWRSCRWYCVLWGRTSLQWVTIFQVGGTWGWHQICSCALPEVLIGSKGHLLSLNQFQFVNILPLLLDTSLFLLSFFWIDTGPERSSGSQCGIL